MKQTFPLNHPRYRQFARAALEKAPDDWEVVLRPVRRSTAQNAALHSCLADIAEQVEWHGKRLDIDIWKRLCTAAWLREVGEAPELIPSLDGHGFDVIFQKTSELSIAEMSSLLEWVKMFAAERGVKLKEPPAPSYEEGR